MAALGQALLSAVAPLGFSELELQEMSGPPQGERRVPLGRYLIGTQLVGRYLCNAAHRGADKARGALGDKLVAISGTNNVIASLVWPSFWPGCNGDGAKRGGLSIPQRHGMLCFVSKYEAG